MKEEMIIKKKKKKKFKIKNIVLVIFMFLFFLLFIFSLIKIVNYTKDNKSNKNIEKIVKEAIKINDDKVDHRTTIDKKYEVDFNALKNENSDTVAYLKVLGTNIDYVILKGKDNDYYLHHSFDKSYNVLGWPFADYHNKFDGTDKNIVIYGHDVKTGVMFGSLKKVLTEEWQKDEGNRKIIFKTEKESGIYEVFSTYTIDPEDYYITTNFKNEDDYEQFLNKIRFRSNKVYGVSVTTDDSILTLSSCTNSGTKRVVLHAKKVQ